jgi:hypothetical protein
LDDSDGEAGLCEDVFRIGESFRKFVIGATGRRVFSTRYTISARLMEEIAILCLVAAASAMNLPAAEESLGSSKRCQSAV